MSYIEKLKNLNIENNALISLTFEEGTDVFHYNETEVETAISETSVISEFANLVAQPGLDVRTRWQGNVLEHLRSEDYLEDYERGSFSFEEYLADTIAENFYDVELIDYSTEKYDHKRGFTTLTAAVEIPFDNFVKTAPFISGWTVSVETDNGTLTFDA
ncbi:MAG TPA: hypothetical protein DCM40_16645 [Maribacter sp.]|nr:hypothetical protein [Maribacter sp.]